MAVAVQLAAGAFRLDQQAGAGAGQIHHLAGAQSPVALGLFIETLGIGEGILRPGKQSQSFLDGVQQDR